MSDDQTIFEAIRDDHDVHRQLLAELAQTVGDSQARERLFLKLTTELKAHAKAEELTLYAALIADEMTVENSRHSIAEHKEIDDYLDALQDTDYSSSGWLVTMKKLKDRAEHHMAEEEKELFPVAGRVLADSQKRQLAQEFLDYKKDAVGDT